MEERGKNVLVCRTEQLTDYCWSLSHLVSCTRVNLLTHASRRSIIKMWPIIGRYSSSLIPLFSFAFPCSFNRCAFSAASIIDRMQILWGSTSMHIVHRRNYTVLYPETPFSHVAKPRFCREAFAAVFYTVYSNPERTEAIVRDLSWRFIDVSRVRDRDHDRGCVRITSRRGSPWRASRDESRSPHTCISFELPPPIPSN